MKILIACEYSGVVRDAFIQKGHDAMSCDILPTERPGPHYEGDVFDIINDGWDMMIAHPPCTYLSLSGARWLYTGPKGARVHEPNRWAKMRDGALFFKALWEANIEKIAIENPTMHGHATQIIGTKNTQAIQPWEHGCGETKRTCLWLKNLPLIVPSNVVPGRYPKTWHISGKDRGKLRSLTYQGIADAWADQWG